MVLPASVHGAAEKYLKNSTQPILKREMSRDKPLAQGLRTTTQLLMALTASIVLPARHPLLMASRQLMHKALVTTDIQTADAQGSVSIMGDTLLDRRPLASPFDPADLDITTLGKPGRLGIPNSAGYNLLKMHVHAVPSEKASGARDLETSRKQGGILLGSQPNLIWNPVDPTLPDSRTVSKTVLARTPKVHPMQPGGALPTSTEWKFRQLQFGKVGQNETSARSVEEYSIDLGAGGGALPGPEGRPKKLHLLRNLLSGTEVRNLLDLTKQLPFQAIEPSANAIVTQFEMLASKGVWATEETSLHSTEEISLASAVKPIVDQRLLPYMRKELRCPSLVVETVMLRQYEADDPKYAIDDPSTRKTIHFDFDAWATAVIDLTPEERSGLFVGFGTEESTQFFVPFESPGDVAIHRWDVAHGVRLQPKHARVSLIVWTRPAVDVKERTISWYIPEAANGNADASYCLGLLAEADGDSNAARDHFHVAAQHGHTYARARLNRLLRKLGWFGSNLWKLSAPLRIQKKQ